MRKDLVVFRCKCCIEALKEHNPYVDSEGKKIPLDRIEVIEVGKDFCENSEINLYSNPRLQTPIKLDGYSEKPWKVVFWNSNYDREQGLSEEYGQYESFTEAKEAVKFESLSKYWAAYEIQLDDGEESEAIYIHANCRPLADEFIKIATKKAKLMSHDRAMCLLSEIVEHTCVARKTSEAIEHLFRLGFADDELTDVFNFGKDDVDEVIRKIEEDT